MQVKSLEIRQANKWTDEEKNKIFVGLVTLVGETGKQEIALSSSTIAKIFALIRSDAAATAKQNAAMVSSSLEEAETAPLLLEQMSLEQ
jgi:hypothetical protein